jgi:hypothetical protein
MVHLFTMLQSSITWISASMPLGMHRKQAACCMSVGIEAAARDDREQVGLNLGLHTGRDTGETFRCLQQIVWIT